MARLWALDKYLKAGTVYETPKRLAYIIQAVGTNSSGEAYLKIEEQDTGTFDGEVAPLRITTSNTLGPLFLGDYSYVIPPETKFEFIGVAGSVCRVIGDVVMLDVGEGLLGELMNRFKVQGDKKIKLYSGSLSLATDEVWGAGEEKTVFTLTPTTIETVKFDGFIGVKMSGGTINEGDFAVIFYIDDTPVEVRTADNLDYGIDVKNMPLPPNDTNGWYGFSLENFPIELRGDHTLTIKIKNISGADKAPPTGSAWSATVKLLGKYERS